MTVRQLRESISDSTWARFGFSTIEDFAVVVQRGDENTEYLARKISIGHLAGNPCGKALIISFDSVQK